MAGEYPVKGRSELRNRRIAAHEIGHCFAGRAIGTFIHLVTIVPDYASDGYQGRTVRSGPVTELALNDSTVLDTDEIVSICERLERLTPELGSSRAESSEYYQRCQNNIIELVAAEEAELLLHPGSPSLGAQHDFIEADAFARVAVAAQPAVRALIEYCKAEARALLEQNIDIVEALVEALIAKGTLVTDEIDAIISAGMTARSASMERQRRADWKQRERNAVTFEVVTAKAEAAR
jgi:hypothetical protein